MTRTAIVFGVTGIAGRAIAERLTGQGWRVVGVSRHGPQDLPTVAPNGGLRHAALMTGLKHYLGSFENYAQTPIETPFTEDMPRVPGENFYYTQEDILFAAAKQHGFTWSVARPHTVIGYAPGNV